MRKIDVSKFSHFLFVDEAHKVQDSMSQLYKNGNYIEYIKSMCISSFFSQCNFLFSMRGGFVPVYEAFPESGRGDFQIFKKAGLVEKIPIFNENYSDFYRALTPDFERIVSMLSEHLKRWKTMPAFQRVELEEELQKKYSIDDNANSGYGKLYELYFIYENQYLHEQFERFLSAKDFTEWWDNEVLKILEEK